MSSKAMKLKAKINNYAKQNKIAAQVVLQNYMLERFLQRLSLSEYKDKFIIKGGVLITSIVGLDTRTTMDLDTTIRNLTLTEENISKTLKNISTINLDDNVEFKLIGISEIRKNDVYGGYCARIDAIYDKIITPLSIDFSTGDIITPAPVKYVFQGILDEDIHIELWGYNTETVLAEKIETILSRGIFNTRMRDFYDAYIFLTTQDYDISILKDALIETSKYRGSLDTMQQKETILDNIESNVDLIRLWDKYKRKFKYAQDIEFIDIINVLGNTFEKMK